MQLVILILESTLYLVCLAFLASGKAQGVIAFLPFAQPIIWALAVITIAGLLAITLVSRDLRFPIRACIAASLVVLAATYLPGGIHSGNTIQFYHAAYFAVILIAAAWGALLPWLAGVAVFAIGLFGNAVALLLSDSAFASGDSTLPILTGAIQSTGILIGYLAGAGLITYLVAQRRLGSSASHPAPASRHTDVPAAVATTARDSAHLQSAQLTTTGAFTIEYATDVKQFNEADFNDLLSSVVFFMSRNFKAYSAMGFIFDPAQQAFLLNSYSSKSAVVLQKAIIPVGRGIVGQIATQKHSFMSGDLSLYPQELLYYGSTELINSVIAVPIASEKKELLGALIIDSKDKNAFNDQNKETLNRFSGLAAALITNARMRMYQERTAQQFKIFYEASQRFTTTLKAHEVFDVLIAMAGQLTYTTRIMAVVFNQERKVGIIQKISGYAQELQEGIEFPINTGLYSFAFQKRTIVTVPDLRQHWGQYYRFVPEEPANQNISALIILPIIDDEAQCLGLLSLESDKPAQFSGDVEQVLGTLVGNASVAFNRALLYQRMETLATTDGLTGLNNHRNFQEMLSIELERAKRYNQVVSLLLMDIDHFKSFNDTYGHPVGDLVLKEIAACIKQSTRKTDTTARYGGEEFTVIMPMTDEQNGVILAERIRTTVQNHVIASMERQLHVTVSIGIATFPVHAQSQKDLIDNADKAMYHSKENGRNRVTTFHPGLAGKKPK